MNKNLLARDIATIGLFIALQIIVLRFLSITTPYIRVDFTFIPIALCAILYGPVKGGIAAATADVVGFMLFPPPFPFFPGWTLSAFITGAIFGAFLHRKQKSLFRFAVPVIVILAVKNLGLDTLWVLMMTSENFFALTPVEMFGRFAAVFPLRAIHLIMAPVQIIVLTLLWEHGLKRFEPRFVSVE
jgi:ECF transporter S component (folate family)